MHDLLRAYAAELSDADTEEDRAAAVRRLLDYCLHATATAMDTLYPHERDSRPRPAVGPSPAPPLGRPEQAREWLDRQRADLVAASRHATGCGRPWYAVQLSQVLYRYLDGHAHYDEALAIHRNAVHAASGDQRATASVLTNLGIACWRLGHAAEAQDHLRRALASYRVLMWSGSTHCASPHGRRAHRRGAGSGPGRGTPDLGLRCGLHDQPGAQPGHAFQHFAQVTAGTEQRVATAATQRGRPPPWTCTSSVPWSPRQPRHPTCPDATGFCTTPSDCGAARRCTTRPPTGSANGSAPTSRNSVCTPPRSPHRPACSWAATTNSSRTRPPGQRLPAREGVPAARRARRTTGWPAAEPGPVHVTDARARVACPE
jgi:hypothetical protein